MTRFTLSACALLLASQSAYAQANAKIPDSDPEVERKSFIVADGFEVNLFASDPLLAKPIQMNFDERGRLWVASSEIYPQIKPGQKANDKIVILEDTKGVGKADKVTIFADGLLIPTAVEPGDGGAYVANSTELLHLSASKEGGKADKSRVVLSGFGTEDTHHILHTLRWGNDGSLFMNQSVYIHSHIETPDGVKRMNGGGVWRFRPKTVDLEPLLFGFWNTWGHHFTRYGQSILTDGAGGEGPAHGLLGAGYPAAVGFTNILHGMNPGSPKYCGCEIIDGRHLPPEWRGNVITNDFRGHRVCRFVLSDDGSTYSSREMAELIKTTHGAFRPIDVKMGPDGAIYIADWYNPIIQHGEVDFRDPRRDQTHGRIWRITAKNRPLVERPKLAGEPVEKLLAELRSEEGWTRQRARRVLIERGADAVKPALEKFVAQLDFSKDDDETVALEALWLRCGLDLPLAEQTKKLLTARKGEVRAAAARVALNSIKQFPDAGEVFAKLAVDPFPRVRLEAIRALGKVNKPESAEAALAAADLPTDKFIDYAFWLTLRELESAWLPALRDGRISFGGDPKKLTLALKAARDPAAARPLVELLKAGKIAVDKQAAVWELVVKQGGPDELADAFSRALDPKTGGAERAALIGLLGEAAKARNVKPSGDLARLKTVFPDPALRESAFRLAGVWKLPVAADLLAVLQGNGPVDVKESALEALALVGGPEAKAELVKLSSDASLKELRGRAIGALAALDLKASAAKATEYLAGGPPEPSVESLVQTLLGRKGADAALAQALKDKTLPADTAKVALRAVRAAGRPIPELSDALTKAGKLASIKREKSPAEMKEFLTRVAQSGDAARGEAIFRRKEMQCLNCHAIGSAGGAVGPELGSIGASAPPDYLVESLLVPNKAVKEGYHAITVVTLAGVTTTGVKVREDKQALVIRTADDKEVTVRIDEIDEKRDANSLMPEGLLDVLTQSELADLARFLTELGKVGPYSQPKARLARRWEVLQNVGPSQDLLRRKGVIASSEKGGPAVWAVTYSEVSGVLPVNELPQISPFGGVPPIGVARTAFEATTGGKLRLKFEDVNGLSAYLDGKALDLKPEVEIEAGQGVHSLVLVVEHSKRSKPIRVELDEVEGSKARGNWVGGK